MTATSVHVPPPPSTVRRIVEIALEEDLGRGDVTTSACVPENTQGRARVVARAELIVCGMDVVAEVYRQVDAQVRVTTHVLDGAVAAPSTVVAELAGSAQSLLMGERVALNLLQRMSGVATITRRYVDALPPDSTTRIVDTRKTTPGLRALERYGVRCGGGHNHREDLSSAVLIKDNHIAAAGGVSQAVRRARAHAPHTSRIEVEVDTMAQLREAISARADIIMLDNFDDTTLGEAVREVAGRALIEVSGGVTLERIARIAAAGVDIISVGALTHSARAVDIGLDWA